MKIICVGRNYVDHAKELGNDIPEQPVIFLKPDTSIIQKGLPFFYPDFSKSIHYEAEIVVKINRLGKNIDAKYAHRYYSDISLGIDFTARDLQKDLKEKGLPWERAKSFDGSAAIGKFVPVKSLKQANNINFRLHINKEEKQKGQSSEMLFSIDQLIENISKFITLKIGDLIFTGTPSGVGPIAINDRIEGFIEEEKVLDLKIK